MSKLDNAEFGSFLSELRREKGLTQKELAERLLVSAKAVSKWETGANMPDVSLLIPLADILGITVTELLRCEKNRQEDLNSLDVEKLVKKAIYLKGKETQNNSQSRKKYIILFFVSLIVAILETFVLIQMDYNSYYIADFIPFMIVALVLSIYFTFIVRDRLPTFYDENRINFYSDGILRMNMPGLYFNNSNWPHISNYIRVWSDIMMAASPIFFYVFNKFLPVQLSGFIALFIMLGTLMIPVYVIGKKYE